MITAASSRKHKTLRIHYVKLSAPAQYLAEWPADASKQHLGEMFQVYSEERMRAYIQLGYYTIMNHLREATWLFWTKDLIIAEG